MEKKQIFGDIKSQNEHYIGVKNSKLMMDFMKAKQKKEFINKPKDEAPITISNNYKIQRFNNKPDDIIRRPANAEFNLNLPNNLNLINIAQFETMNIPMENYLNEEQEENYLPLSNNNRIYADDTQNYQTPIDILKNQNKKNTNNTNSNNNYNNNTNNNQHNNNNMNNNYSNNNYNNNLNNKSLPEISIPQINNNININNSQNLNNQSNNNNNNNTLSKPVPIKQNKINIPIPQAPPINLPQPKKDQNINPPTEKNIPPAKVKFTGNPSNGKNDVYSDTKKIVDIKEVEKINEGRGGLLEALKCDNPMAKLRKSGTIPLKVSESKFKF
jgi:hypothetical protein